MKDLVLVRGISGSGKTTVANMFNGIHITTDSFWYDAQGNYNFDASKLSEAHEWCRKSVDILMSNGEETIVVHNTFTKEWEMKPYFDLAKIYGYRVHTVIVENRHGSKNVHNVPDDVLEKQKSRFEVVL